MSFRSVEMQIAIPRTSEAGSVQNHLSQKPVYDQAALAAKSIEQKERQLQQSAKVDEAAEPQIRDDQQRGSKGRRDRSGAKPKSGKTNNASGSPEGNHHPYKGHHIDFSL